jgi:hypothetical protein
MWQAKKEANKPEPSTDDEDGDEFAGKTHGKASIDLNRDFQRWCTLQDKKAKTKGSNKRNKRLQDCE